MPYELVTRTECARSSCSLWLESQCLVAARLGRGFLTGPIDENTSFDDSDNRNTLTRFTSQARRANQVIVDLLRDIGVSKRVRLRH